MQFRALLLLVALCLSLAGQFSASFAAGVQPMASMTSAQALGAGGCSGCDGTDTGMAPQCVGIACPAMVAILPIAPAIVPTVTIGFMLPSDNLAIGLSPRPDPHPPRISAHI